MRTDMHGGPTMAAHTEDDGDTRVSLGRIAAWGAGALLLLLPLVAMQFTNEVVWTGLDFAFAGTLIFGALGAYELAVRRTAAHDRAALGIAVVGGFMLVWSVAAVGLLDGPADLMYGGVLAVGFVGALVARFRAHGMAHAMFAMALAMAAVGVGAVLTGSIPASNTPFQILGITGFFFALWLASAGLFWEAARAEDERAGV